MVKHSIWKAGHDLLPTNVSLFKKNINETNFYPLCEREIETIVHALCSCPATSDVWAEHDSPVQKCYGTKVDFLELWKKLNLYLKADEVELVAYTMRRIWLKRNSLIFDHKFEDPRRVLRAAKQGLDEFTLAQNQ